MGNVSSLYMHITHGKNSESLVFLETQIEFKKYIFRIGDFTPSGHVKYGPGVKIPYEKRRQI